MASADVHGPIDVVLIEFAEDRLNGGVTTELLDLVDRGIVSVIDVLVLGKSADGEVYDVDLAATAVGQAAGLVELTTARTGLLSEDDMRLAATAMEPGTVGILIAYENTWAIPFVAAAREAGGELIGGARIPAPDVIAALDELDRAEARTPAGTAS